MISHREISAVLSRDDPRFLEQMARRARQITRRHFGACIGIYAPLYLSNYCDNHCTYCGFGCRRRIQRRRLTFREMETEMTFLARRGIREILLLTGESRRHSPPDYIAGAIRIARKYFTSIGIEVYPLEVLEYRELYREGVESVTIYQETYDREKYAHYHIKGRKKNYSYRYHTPARAAEAGIRMINMGVLFGLSEPSGDLYRLYAHLEWMQRHYPGVEYTLSVPRIIPLADAPDPCHVLSDRDFAKVIMLTRILFPSVGINVSTRENAFIRDHVLPLGVTRMSAGSRTTVGGYSVYPERDPQFDIRDLRPVKEITGLLKKRGYDPVFTSWRPIENQPPA